MPETVPPVPSTPAPSSAAPAAPGSTPGSATPATPAAGVTSEAQTVDVDFATWASVSSRLLRRSVADRARIIHESGFDATWRKIDSHWFAVLAGEAEDGNLTRIDRYRELCEDEIDRRRKDGEDVPSPADRVSTDSPAGRDSGDPKRARTTTSPFTEAPDSDKTPNEIDPDQGETQIALHDVVKVTMEAANEAMTWPLEKYAWLCAELAHAPDRADQVWSLHGLSKGPARSAVRKAWKQKLDDDPQLAEQHSQLVQRYSDVLRGE